MRILLPALLLVPLVTAAADDPASLAFFEQKIRPVLVEHCYECHSTQAKKLKSGLYLDSKAGWQKGGESGKPIIVPGQPDQSLLLRSIQHLEPDLEMPPKKPKLPDAVVADFVAWIKAGAADPRDQATAELKRADKSWWSLQPLTKEFQHPNIDGFIDAKLHAQKLTRSAPAQPQALIRRLSYDLTGLPPTQAEVDAFVTAHRTNARQATEALVDRLLASPRYGEHWGRHWLDVVRFGESNGFERNVIVDDLYPFRDYVIRSLNDDKPFDQLIREHLAGDVLGKFQPEIEIGSAFLVAGPYDNVGNQDAVAQKVIRAATLDDMVTATGGAFLGLTINCARCHNHKFDPIPTEDYYRIRAAFEGVVHGRRTLATQEQTKAFNAAISVLNQERGKVIAEQDALTKAIEAKAKDLLAARQSGPTNPPPAMSRWPPMAPRLQAQKKLRRRISQQPIAPRSRSTAMKGHSGISAARPNSSSPSPASSKSTASPIAPPRGASSATTRKDRPPASTRCSSPSTARRGRKWPIRMTGSPGHPRTPWNVSARKPPPRM